VASKVAKDNRSEIAVLRGFPAEEVRENRL